MVLRRLALIAVIMGVILTAMCVFPLLPDSHAVIHGNQSYKYANIGEIVMCGAPLGLSFILALIAAIGGE